MTGGRLWTLHFKRLFTRKPTLKTHQPAAEFDPILMLTKKPPRKRWLISNYSKVARRNRYIVFILSLLRVTLCWILKSVKYFYNFGVWLH